jgi:hypothetical protein
MPSGSYGDLRRLSSDPAYLVALEALYVGTSLPVGVGRRGLWMLGLVLAAVAALAAAAWWVLPR